MFRGIHPRLAGIGVASVFSAYIIVWYYNVIISWALVYFIAGFHNPLPWSQTNPDFDSSGCDMTKTSRAEKYLMTDVLRLYDEHCEAYENGKTT